MTCGNITINSPYSITDNSYTIDTGTNYSFDLNNVTLGGIVGGGVIGASNSVYTTTGYNGSWGGIYNAAAAVNLDHNGIKVTESADIKLGNVSLKDFINKIEQRLALLTPNPELENEWDELKDLGDRYRELEKQITEKMKTWEILKSDGDQTGK